MFYQTARCPHCRKFWVLHRIDNRPFNKIGPPLIRCSGCGGVSRTKYVLWEQATPSQKLFKRLDGLFTLMFVGGITALFWFFHDSEFSYWNLVIYGVSVLFVWMLYNFGRWLRRCDEVMTDNDEFIKENMDENSAVSSQFWYHDVGG